MVFSSVENLEALRHRLARHQVFIAHEVHAPDGTLRQFTTRGEDLNGFVLRYERPSVYARILSSQDSSHRIDNGTDTLP
ncbi:hypothetical protein OG585_52920 (plasmid) [Streptomyces sp. NBC_01340]|uniref:hypothetical protein n=1 Tax=Streptomyces sp. NBC_01340 TaxID=2903830 RepID=UPI002E150725|nr:hypothetical protein OG585_52920 [Streptomyces sp. NBC_01340]